MKSLKNTLQESLRIGIYDEVKVTVYESLRIGTNDQPEIPVDELVDEYLKPHFNKGQTVTFPSTNFSIKDACADQFINNDVLLAISDDPNIENELNDLWQEMIKYKIYHFGYDDDIPKLWKKEVQYIYDFIYSINNSGELTNIYQKNNFSIDSFISSKYMFFVIYNNKSINIWLAEK